MRPAVVVLTAALCASAVQAQEPAPTFGTTVVVPSGLRGLIFHIRHNSKRLPDLRKKKPVGTIYTASLNIAPQSFNRGFPGVTRRFEWFAIDYTGKFWIENPGPYRFSLLSDDGSKLYIDDHLVVDNDGLHMPVEKTGRVELNGGIHRIRVSYFQGPRFEVALVLRVAADDGPWRVFSTDEFKPPPNPETWRYPSAAPSSEKRFR